MQLTLIKELNINNKIGHVIRCLYDRTVTKDEEGMPQYHFKLLDKKIMTVADFRKAHDYHHVLSLDAAIHHENPKEWLLVVHMYDAWANAID